MLRKRPYLLAAPLVLWTACASLTHHRNEVALAKVKKVAVVGFVVREPKAKKIGMTEQTVAEVDAMYAELAKAFHRRTGWSVLPVDKMKGNPAYQSVFEKTMKGFQNKMPPTEGQQFVYVENILDHDCLRIIGRDGRAGLIKALGVDALITAEVTVQFSGTSVMGFGSQYPQSHLSFQAYTANTDSPDWFEGDVEGETAKTSVGATGFFDEKLMQRLALESARTAYSKIGAKE